MDRNSADARQNERRNVALRKESVDRNYMGHASPAGDLASLSARRAWIEIIAKTQKVTGRSSRSPQGERG